MAGRGATARQCPHCQRWFRWALDLYEHQAKAHPGRAA